MNQESYTDDTIFEDFEYILKYVKGLETTNNDRIGTIGFCMGGRHGYIAAARYPDARLQYPIMI